MDNLACTACDWHQKWGRFSGTELKYLMLRVTANSDSVRLHEITGIQSLFKDLWRSAGETPTHYNKQKH